ncbi:hypothetical protein L208DRAFT_177604 [Tricholoma matsutake]|nr:hypothetical protein L208DRAFT_177604 [Tricholoma matsutake 945]
MSFDTPFPSLKPPCSSSSRGRFFFFASPLLSFATSIPCRAFLHCRTSSRSSKLQILCYTTQKFHEMRVYEHTASPHPLYLPLEIALPRQAIAREQ